MAGMTRVGIGVSSTKAVVVLSIPGTSRIRSSTTSEVRVRGGDHPAEQVARPSRPLGLHDLRNGSEVVGHVGPPTLRYLEGDEGRD